MTMISISAGKFRIKPGRRWFAAGTTQWPTAMTKLSDGAFKLFAYVCLHAERSTGRLQFRQARLAQTLGKSRRSLSVYLQELQAQGMFSVELSRNQYTDGTIQIQAEYWPYEPEDSTAQGPDAFVSAIAGFLQSRACVRCAFSPQDRQLAQQWFEQGIELWQIEQAILLGCGRKYVSWLNGTGFAADPQSALFRASAGGNQTGADFIGLLGVQQVTDHTN